VFGYLRLKSATYILIDNLDKGWTPSGISSHDTQVMLCLLDAARKVQRDALKHELEMNICVFLRDDVYEFIVRQTSDRGKDTVVRLSWNDTSAIRTLLNRRISASGRDLAI